MTDVEYEGLQMRLAKQSPAEVEFTLAAGLAAWGGTVEDMRRRVPEIDQIMQEIHPPGPRSRAPVE